MKIEYERNSSDYSLTIIYSGKKEQKLFQQIINGIHLEIEDCIEYGDIELLCSISETNFNELKNRCLKLNVCLEAKEKRNRIPKEKRKAILKELGYDKEDMKYFWLECIEDRNPVIMEYYDNGYMSWKDLPEEIMRQLPQLRYSYRSSNDSAVNDKVIYASNLAKEIRDSIAEDNKTLQWDNEYNSKDLPNSPKIHIDIGPGFPNNKSINRDMQKSNSEFWEQLTLEEHMYHKITSGERLTEKELKTLVFESNQIDEIEGDEHRWTRSIETIVCLCGHYFSICWQRALTEMQEHEFWEQPKEVKPVEKQIIITEWVSVDKEIEIDNDYDEER